MEKTKPETRVVLIQKEINAQLADEATVKALISTTFKGFTPQLMKRAMMEGYFRGFNFKNFLEKDVFAIPYGDTYSLVTSIDYARKKGAAAGIIGKSAPEYEEKDGRIISCSITVK